MNLKSKIPKFKFSGQPNHGSPGNVNSELLKQDLYFFRKVKKRKVRDHKKKHFLFLQHVQKNQNSR